MVVTLPSLFFPIFCTICFYIRSHMHIEREKERDVRYVLVLLVLSRNVGLVVLMGVGSSGMDYSLTMW